MYALIATNALLRIVAALLALFVGVPALARRRPAELDRMEWFWWCLAAGVTALTIGGQLLMLLNVFSTATLLLAIAVLILATRAHLSGRPAFALLRDLSRAIAVSSLNILEGRVNLRRRLRRTWRRTSVRLRAALAPRATRWSLAGWGALILISAVLRLIRPFATANLGFSDTYAHLYLFRLLEQGRQVDPAWGPYPRGMHFLLLAIHDLTNVDAILLLNFFGAIVGVLMTIAVADTARRMAGSLRAGVVAGLLFATMTGGAAQYYLLGGSITTAVAEEGRQFVSLPHSGIPQTDGEYDVLQTVFQRQTATLPQELAIVFLFPAAMFLFRRSSRWHLSGYFFCTAAIAAVHPGVAVPLIMLSAVTVLVTRASFRDIRNAILVGAAGIAVGSTWMIAYVRYRRVVDATADVASGSSASTAAMYYFPFLREGEAARMVTWVAITPFVIACAILAIALIVRALFLRSAESSEHRAALFWTSLAALVFLTAHVASRFGIPELVEVRRNSSWLVMALTVLTSVALIELARTRAAKLVNAAAVLLLAVWMLRVPVAEANDRLINYSGYNATAYTVLDVARRLEPFTWTLVTYGQEFPMVLGRGFHLPAADFLEQYNPEEPRLRIPTRYVFIIVEKKPHRFEINTWASRFSRGNLQQRLQTWCYLYQLSHRDLRVYHDDEQVRVYVIERSEAEVRKIAEEGS